MPGELSFERHGVHENINCRVRATELTKVSSIATRVYEKRSNKMSTLAQTTTPRGDGVTGTVTIGSYLATRLEQIGLKHHFVVAGDYNLVLLLSLIHI